MARCFTVSLGIWSFYSRLSNAHRDDLRCLAIGDHLEGPRPASRVSRFIGIVRVPVINAQEGHRAGHTMTRFGRPSLAAFARRERIGPVLTGTLGVPHLESFWLRHRAGQADPGDWVRDYTLLSGLRVGLKETFDYLLRTKPSLEGLESW